MKTDSIAIIGMGCVYPGALSPQELWENVLAGRRYFRRSPDERLPDAYYYDPDPEVIDKTYSNRMAVLSGWSFNPMDWKIPPKTFEQSDIVHWLALHTAAEALKDAEVDFDKTDRTRMGVILGNSGIGEFHRSHLLRNRWPFVERAVRRAVEKTYTGGQADTLVNAIRHFYVSPFPEFREDHLAGNMANVISGRIANYYDFRSASYTVDGACASSLLAVINACDYLASGDMDVALAGGVDVSLDPLEVIGFAKTQALAMDDIRPYDKDAHGMQPGEGCGIVVLATEEYAQRHGYTPRAIIKGWGVSADGSGGITQPKVEGQKYALKKAYTRAGYDISTVGYVEGHGTGTAVGDRVEITALKEALDEAGGDGVCRLGSLKANIGHTKAAAGVAGLIKTAMTLQRKIIPPHVSCSTPNPAFGSPLSNLRPSKGDVWTSGDGPLRASVSAFGFGGVNAHIALEEANSDDMPSQKDLDLIGSAQSSELILLSGRSTRELREKAARLIPVAERICQAEVIDLSAALSRRDHEAQHRLAIITASPWQLAEQLKKVCSKLSEGFTLDDIDSPESGIFAGEARENPKMAGLFPGQGSHRLNMATEYLHRYGFVSEMCRGFEARMFKLTGKSFKERIFRDVDAADEETKKRWEAELRETFFQQPSIISCSMAALKVLAHLGLEPDYAVGHSLGEISALVAGGGLEPVDALHIATLRSRAMDGAAGKGESGMAAIGAEPAKVEDFLQRHNLDLVISNYNTPRQNVVSGAIGEIDRAVELAGREKLWARKLPVSHAFHSEAVAPASEVLRREIEDIPMSPLDGTSVYSTSTGSLLERDTDLRNLLADQIARPVRFLEAVQQVNGQNPDLWVEIGPGEVLSNLVRDIVGAGKIEFFPTDLDRQDNFHLLNRIVSRAFVMGFPVKTDQLFHDRLYRDFDPDHYDPQLIVNPCERPVEPLEKPLALGGSGLPADFLPENASSPSFDAYLSQRGGFLKEFVGLDFRSWSGGGGVQPGDGESDAKPDGKARETGEEVPQEGDRPVIDLVLDWIVERTGYPKEFVTPDKKLRDDLNLDSIKAGELALMLSKKMERELPLDLGIVANATIQYLVDTVSQFEGQRFSTDDSTFSGWIRNFGVELLPAPLGAEEPIALQREGTICVVGDAACRRADAVAGDLAAEGVTVERLTIAEASKKDFGGGTSGLVLVLPPEERNFFEVTPTEFRDRVEGLATSLFALLRRVLSDDVLERERFDCLVLRPAADQDPGADLDGAAGFFKTISLEHNKPGFNWKWITLPAGWEPSKVAARAKKELASRGERVEYHYSREEERLSPTATQIGKATTKAPRMGALDTLLVSGGGKGITFEMAFELARKTGIKLGLLGSSPPPAEDGVGELADNLRRLREEAVRHLYVQADVTSHGEVADAARRIERKLGRVTGILHGAGISRFSEFREMDLEEYLRCIRVKAAGLYNLLAAVPPKRLKTLQVLSSVLGRTGMYRQADYTFANAWLDGATRAVLRSYPKIHGFSVGYTVWEGTGIGAKSGSLEMLQTVGVTPLPIEDGIASYMDLATGKHPYQTFVGTGRLNADVEKRLMPTATVPRWRFLEHVLRFVPGVDLVTEAHLTHEKDTYIPEHVFAGTPLMPTVMGLEGMVQAAMACLGTGEVPAIRDIQLKKPMIIPADGGLKVRTMALCDPAVDGVTAVTVRMRSESDGYAGDHFEIRCLFGVPLPGENDLPAAPVLPEIPYPKSPEDFSPEPLFQGRFFRRITKIYEINEGAGTLTEITVPREAHYYGKDFDQGTRTPAPAIRDAMLQAAALMAPSGYLPESIGEIRFLRPLREGEQLTCLAKAVNSSEDTLKADITLFDGEGGVVEWMRGVTVKATSTKVDLAATRTTKVLDLDSLPAGIRDVANGTALTVSLIHRDTLTKEGIDRLLSKEELASLVQNISEPRRPSRIGNAVAAKRAAAEHLATHLQAETDPAMIGLRHEENGKPELVLAGAGQNLPDLDVSLADSNGTSVALVGHRPVGVDIEAVKPRDTETWKGLLGLEGYGLALELQRETGESFDSSATRVWTLVESGKKAGGRKALLPRLEKVLDSGWVVFRYEEGAAHLALSAALDHDGTTMIFSLTAEDFSLAGEETARG